MSNADNIKSIRAAVRTLLESVNVCESHNLAHMDAVAAHAVKALAFEPSLSTREAHLVICACLLHDVDDKKFFPCYNADDPCPNLRKILRDLSYAQNDIDLVAEMVSYVSWSDNGNTIPPNAIALPWLLIPRHSDRLEAMGWEGVRRCYQYNVTVKRSIYFDTTPRPRTDEEIMETATRLLNVPNSSMLDHYYSKLLHIGNFTTTNPYLIEAMRGGAEPLMQVLRMFGEKGHLTNDDMDVMLSDK